MKAAGEPPSFALGVLVVFTQGQIVELKEPAGQLTSFWLATCRKHALSWAAYLIGSLPPALAAGYRCILQLLQKANNGLAV